MIIEAIPGFMSGVYAWVARTSPFIRDIHKEVAEEICGKISSGRVLDLGTGPGYLLFEIAKRSMYVELAGIDLSSGMVERTRKRAGELGLSGRVTCETANASKVPFADNSFDLVVSTMSLHHWSHPAACFKEIYRVLKPGKAAYIYDLRRDTPPEVNEEYTKRYGRFLAFVLLRFVRAHSSMTSRRAEELLSSTDALFSERSVSAKGVLLRLKLVK